MKITCDVDKQLPLTVRMNAEWRASFRLSRFSDVLLDIRIVVRMPTGSSKSSCCECLIWMLPTHGKKIVVQENALNAADAVTIAIDRAAAAIGRHIRRQARMAEVSRAARADQDQTVEIRNQMTEISQEMS